MSVSVETIQIEREYDLFQRFSLVKTAIHAFDHIAGDTSLRLADRMNALELLADGIKNAIDGRSTGREFRTARHSYLAKHDPQHYPVVAPADQRCQECGARNAEPFTYCWQHRPELPRDHSREMSS